MLLQPTLNSRGLNQRGKIWADDDFLIIQFELFTSLSIIAAKEFDTYPYHFELIGTKDRVFAPGNRGQSVYPFYSDNYNHMFADSLLETTVLSHYQKNQHQDRIPAVPLEWQHLPVDILSKELTKLNNPHPFRIYYLGPRPHSTLAFHKKYGRGLNQEGVEGEHPCTDGQQYRVNLQKIVNPIIGVQTQQSHYKASLFYRAFEGMNPTINGQDQFVFNGAFESGNLDCVIKVRPREFDLFLRIDSNTRGHTGWYFFSIKNGTRKERVTLNICNLRKPSSLYDQGMKPFIFSRKQSHHNKGGWQQRGQSCVIEQSELRYKTVLQEVNTSRFYRLTFQYEFQHQHDEVFFAYCIPYTYSQLQQEVLHYEQSPFVGSLTLGRTLGGLDIPLLHITNRNQLGSKKIAIITARVHPAQSNGSHMAKGLIDFLIGSSKEADELRSTTHFLIVPMLNPDGVVFGNSRTSAAGKDLNRQFLQPQPQLYPQCSQLKLLVGRLNKKGQVFVYIDLHGHSRRKNTFIYGPNYQIQQKQYYQSRILPKIIEKINPGFRYHGCNFVIPEEKKTTARAVMLMQLKIPFVYTVESSTGLYFLQTGMPKIQNINFELKSWQQMGGSIAQALHSFKSIVEELQVASKERKLQRDRKKERSSTSTGYRHSRKQSKQSDLQSDILNLGKVRQSTSNIYCQLMKDIKLSQMCKNNEEDEDSDDHASDEDLPSFKLKSFKMHIAAAQHRGQKSQKQKDFQMFQIGLNEPQVRLPVASEHFQTKSSKKTPEVPKQTKKQSKTIELSWFDGKKGMSKPLPKGKSIQLLERESKSVNRYQIKNFTVSKPRYSLASKQYFPIQQKREAIEIPKNLQVMKKEMKRGRILIHNMEESNMRIIKKYRKQQQEIKRQRKGPFAPTDTVKIRMAGIHRPSYSNIDYPSCFNDAEKDSLVVQGFKDLQAFEVDNLAMKITTFKRR